MTEQEEKISKFGIAAIFAWLAYCFLTFADHDTDGTWYYPLLMLTPPLIATFIFWRLGVPFEEKSIIDDMPEASRATQNAVNTVH